MEKTALVIGLGISGKAAAEFLLSLGYRVYAMDQKKIEMKGVEFLEESDLYSAKRFDLVIPSPGIPSTHPFLLKAAKEEVEIIGEAELALKHMKQKAVAITGTNGKTTVTSLVEHVLLSSGKKAKALGNIGFALTSYVINADPEEIAVVELSSYQLETIKSSVFDAAVLLNITPDHLDRYGTLEEYAKAKINIEKSVKKSGTLYVHEEVSSLYGKLFSSCYQIFGSESEPRLPSCLEGPDRINTCAAWLLCLKLGVSFDSFLKAFASFKKPAHRIEFVKEFKEVKYYDDSKGTNIDAVIKAVHVMKGPVILIAGGVDKGSSYLAWKEPFQGKVKYMFLIGRAAVKIKEELGLFFNVKIVDSLADAVQAASKIAGPGENVLLSPGCSSFDMFQDYVQRGLEFQRCVCLLEEGREI